MRPDATVYMGRNHMNLAIHISFKLRPRSRTRHRGLLQPHDRLSVLPTHPYAKFHGSELPIEKRARVQLSIISTLCTASLELLLNIACSSVNIVTIFAIGHVGAFLAVGNLVTLWKQSQWLTL